MLLELIYLNMITVFNKYSVIIMNTTVNQTFDYVKPAINLSSFNNERSTGGICTLKEKIESFWPKKLIHWRN